jgi:type VI protein secretion system component Hcp
MAWDFATNKGGSVSFGEPGSPNEVAEVFEGELQWFARFEGVSAPGFWLQVHDFDLGVSNSGSTQVGGGGGTGKASFEDAVLALGSSKDIVALTSSLMSGKHLKKVEIDAYREFGGELKLVDEYELTDVSVTGLDTENATHNSLSLSFSKISIAHLYYDDQGKQQGPPVDFDWDLDAGAKV